MEVQMGTTQTAKQNDDISGRFGHPANAALFEAATKRLAEGGYQPRKAPCPRQMARSRPDQFIRDPLVV
jgi:hypothetical protein